MVKNSVQENIFKKKKIFDVLSDPEKWDTPRTFQLPLYVHVILFCVSRSVCYINFSLYTHTHTHIEREGGRINLMTVEIQFSVILNLTKKMLNMYLKLFFFLFSGKYIVILQLHYTCKI